MEFLPSVAFRAMHFFVLGVGFFFYLTFLYMKYLSSEINVLTNRNTSLGGVILLA